MNNPQNMYWIKCSDQEPHPDEERIIVYSVNKKIHIVHRDYDDWVLDETDIGFPGESISFTHWMPIINNPED